MITTGHCAQMERSSASSWLLGIPLDLVFKISSGFQNFIWLISSGWLAYLLRVVKTKVRPAFNDLRILYFNPYNSCQTKFTQRHTVIPDSTNEERLRCLKFGERLQRTDTGTGHWTWQDFSREVGSISSWDVNDKKKGAQVEEWKVSHAPNKCPSPFLKVGSTRFSQMKVLQGGAPVL